MLKTLINAPLVFAFNDASDAYSNGHVFCGAPESSSSLCPNCQLPLMRLMTLDLTDKRLLLEQAHHERLELLFCWQCELSQKPFVYKQLPGSNIEILSCGRGRKIEGFPYADYPRFFPESSVDLRPMDSELSGLIESYATLVVTDDPELDNWDMEVRFRIERPRHQIGGTPFLFDYQSFNCPECNQEMSFLATIADQNTDPRGFVDNNYVQVVYYICPECMVVGVRQETD